MKNLAEILKGHEGETFYNPYWGNIILSSMDETDIVFDIPECDNELFVNHYGQSFNTMEMCVFPSKDERNWDTWSEKQKNNPPKTWIQLIKSGNHYDSYDLGRGDLDVALVEFEEFNSRSYSYLVTPVEKSALALLRIHQLIEVGYGGNPSTKEKINRDNSLYEISIDSDGELTVEYLALPTNHIAFHTKEQAEEFLSYLENIQLLKDYFMIN